MVVFVGGMVVSVVLCRFDIRRRKEVHVIVQIQKRGDGEGRVMLKQFVQNHNRREFVSLVVGVFFVVGVRVGNGSVLGIYNPKQKQNRGDAHFKKFFLQSWILAKIHD